MRNRFNIHADATVQYFYGSDGMISFVVLGVEKFTIITDTNIPQPQAATP